MDHGATHNGALNRFVRNECSKQCQTCKVIAGAKCTYFERAVLGPPDYPHRQPGYDYSKLFAQYARINPKLAGSKVAVRYCDCGEVLGHRERLCPKCRGKHRKQTYRKFRANRKHRRATVKAKMASANALF